MKFQILNLCTCESSENEFFLDRRPAYDCFLVPSQWVVIPAAMLFESLLLFGCNIEFNVRTKRFRWTTN